MASQLLAEKGFAWPHPRSRSIFFAITFRPVENTPVFASAPPGHQTPSSAWWSDRALRRDSGSAGISPTGPVSRRAATATPPSHQADEPPSARAPETEPTSPAPDLTTIPDAPRGYGAPTPPCSAFRLLSSPGDSQCFAIRSGQRFPSLQR